MVVPLEECLEIGLDATEGQIADLVIIGDVARVVPFREAVVDCRRIRECGHEHNEGGQPEQRFPGRRDVAGWRRPAFPYILLERGTPSFHARWPPSYGLRYFFFGLAR